MICIGGRTPPVVHVAGGENRIVDDGGSRRFDERYEHATRPLPDVLAEPTRRPTRMAELHAMLVRTGPRRGRPRRALLDRVRAQRPVPHSAVAGRHGLARALVGRRLRARAPAARHNLEYHLLRWCRRWIDDSLAAFCAKWRLPPDDPSLLRDLASLHSRRRRPLAPLRGAARRVGGARAVSMVDRAADRWVDDVLRPRHDGAQERA